jgi:secernin
MYITSSREGRERRTCEAESDINMELEHSPILGCDTMVALPETTAHGQVILAKNSDRPAHEAQPLELHAFAIHGAGERTGCRCATVPQAPATFRHVGSRPWWCWGYEHGFNEHQVVIGNEGLPSRVPAVSEPRLFGMELVRLGLERGRTAAEALRVICDHVERYGQGKFENDLGARTYDNGYLIADPHEAYILETMGKTWAARRASGAESIGNVSLLGEDAQRLSANAESFAAELGLHAPTVGERFRFAAAFGDRAASPSGIARQGRTSALLRQHSGGITAETMMSILRDHSDGEAPDEPFVEDVQGSVSVCTHRRDPGTPAGAGGDASTAASLVADLCADGSRLPVYWCSLYSPCMAVFFPVFLEAKLPPILGIGCEVASPDSPWWRFHDLVQDALERGPERRRQIREAWRPLQAEWLQSAYDVASRGRDLIANGATDRAEQTLTTYVAQNVDRMLGVLRELSQE